MAALFVFIVVFNLIFLASPATIPEDVSVVSVYTTHPTTAGAASPTLDVYQQIADNIAERITRPINNFLGISTPSKTQMAMKHFQNLETFDEEENPQPVTLVDNSLTKDRDVEQLSDAIFKTDNKPEKINLLNSILATFNRTTNYDTTTNSDVFDIDDPSDDDFNIDDMKHARNGSLLVSFVEWVASVIELAKGAYAALFNRNRYEDVDNTEKPYRLDVILNRPMGEDGSRNKLLLSLI